MSIVNHQFRLAARPIGLPKRSDWNLTEEPLPVPGEGEFLVKVLYISLDPAIRGYLKGVRRPAHSSPFELRTSPDRWRRP